MEKYLSFLTTTIVGVLFVLSLADVISGLLKSAKQRRWSSDISYAGMTRKCGMLLLVGVAYVLESFSKFPLVFPSALYYSVTEGMSFIENLNDLGVSIPPVIGQYFKKLQDQTGSSTPPTNAADLLKLLSRRDDDPPTT